MTAAICPHQSNPRAEQYWGRPIFHKKDERVEAHIFVATLALFLKRSLEHQLAAPLPELSNTDALSAMKSIGIAELSLNGRNTRLVSGGGRDAGVFSPPWASRTSSRRL